jgi:hypothetical protein
MSERDERTVPSVLPGYWRRHADKGDQTQHGKSSGDRSRDQPATRKSKAGLSGVAERPAVLKKPVNAGGREGASLERRRKKRRGNAGLAMTEGRTSQINVARTLWCAGRGAPGARILCKPSGGGSEVPFSTLCR